MGSSVFLTKREAEIAEMIAWGATKKEIASRLFISCRTVENTARNIYVKTGVSKANELSAWWFCKTFNISFTLSPLKRKAFAIILLILFVPYELSPRGEMIRARRLRTECRARKNEDVFPEINIEL